ncbi:chemosensory protein 2 [Daphnia sinensis]|uniref:Chemosensory protein 2 n=2 Tax=Daphnia TaxID=6668 RepID=A0AAD5KT01_9CRUS|nr:chemonsensory protein 2 [Daphnia carinata]KAI9559956.1 chemosensory protein 2 [Daphnia sinensis]
MNSTIVAFLALAALAAVVSAQPGPALENVDVDNVLKNEKLVRRYIDCTLDRGRCEQNGRDLKAMLPRVLNEGCRGCTPKQVENSNRIINFMKTNHAADWAAIETKYKTG